MSDNIMNAMDFIPGVAKSVQGGISGAAYSITVGKTVDKTHERLGGVRARMLRGSRGAYRALRACAGDSKVAAPEACARLRERAHPHARPTDVRRDRRAAHSCACDERVGAVGHLRVHIRWHHRLPRRGLVHGGDQHRRGGGVGVRCEPEGEERRRAAVRGGHETAAAGARAGVALAPRRGE